MTALLTQLAAIALGHDAPGAAHVVLPPRFAPMFRLIHSRPAFAKASFFGSAVLAIFSPSSTPSASNAASLTGWQR
jgi:hypothetical protein